MNSVAIVLQVLLGLVFLLPGSMKPKRPHLPNIRKDIQPHVTLTRFCGAGERGNSLDLLLIHDRTDIAQRGMQPLSIVKNLQILKDRLPSLFPRLRGLSLYALGLQGANETLHERVIVAIGFAAHAHDDAKVGQKGSVVLTGILTAPVSMMQ